MILIVSIIAMSLGLLIVVLGAFLSITEARRTEGDELRGPTEFVSSLAKLMDSLASHPVGIRLIALGLVLYVLGSVSCLGVAVAA